MTAPDIDELVARLTRRWEDSDQPVAAKVNRLLRDCREAAAVLSTLSHPETVAQEAVAWDVCLEDGTVTQNHRNEAHARASADYLSANGCKKRIVKPLYYAHPSPSPEQGEDALAIAALMEVDELERYGNATSRSIRPAISALRARVAESACPIGLDATHEICSAGSCLTCTRFRYGHYYDRAKKAEARVAELEARTTPQAGASEAEPLAYASAGQIGSFEDRPGDEGGVYIPLRKTPIGNFQMPLYATPPDRDAVRAATLQEAMNAAYSWPHYLGREGMTPGADGLLQPGSPYDRGRYDARKAIATLSNQGSSSNGQ